MFLENAIEVPHRPGVTVMHANVVEISRGNKEGVKTGIRNIVNGSGNGVGADTRRATLVSFVDGIATTARGTAVGARPRDEDFHIPIVKTCLARSARQ